MIVTTMRPRPSAIRAARCQGRLHSLWSQPMSIWFLLALALVQTPTSLTLEVAPGLDVDYSDAVLASVDLSAGGSGLAGQRIDFFLSNTDHDLGFSPGSLLGTGSDGSAGPLRIRFVDGAYGVDHLFAADPDGLVYTLEARFSQTVSGGVTYTASHTSVELRLHREPVVVQLLPEHTATLGDPLEVFATLLDQNGDAEESGSGTSGRVARTIAGATIHFYCDLNGDGDWGDLDEALGTAPTNGDGVAVLSFDTTPYGGLPRAGLHADALRAEFSGDDRYKFSAGVGDLRLEPAALAVDRTRLTATPASAIADGYSQVLIEATLIDRFNNALGPDADFHAVVFTASAGTLLDNVLLDPLTGRYTQQLEAPTASATARVSISVDDTAGPSIEVAFTPGECGCRGATAPAVTLPLLAGLALLAARRRNRQ